MKDKLLELLEPLLVPMHEQHLSKEVWSNLNKMKAILEGSGDVEKVLASDVLRWAKKEKQRLLDLMSVSDTLEYVAQFKAPPSPLNWDEVRRAMMRIIHENKHLLSSETSSLLVTYLKSITLPRVDVLTQDQLESESNKHCSFSDESFFWINGAIWMQNRLQAHNGGGEKWVSVGEGQPKNDEVVEIKTPEGECMAVYYKSEDRYYHKDEVQNATHWKRIV